MERDSLQWHATYTMKKFDKFIWEKTALWRFVQHWTFFVIVFQNNLGSMQCPLCYRILRPEQINLCVQTLQIADQTCNDIRFHKKRFWTTEHIIFFIVMFENWSFLTFYQNFFCPTILFVQKIEMSGLKAHLYDDKNAAFLR